MWDAWVLVVWCAVAGAARLDSPDLSLLEGAVLREPSGAPTRKITVKSVFIVPPFCSEGYRQDILGRCNKIIKINPEAQLNFYLTKLNAIHAKPSNRPSDKTGPLRLPIPLVQSVTTTTEAPPTETPTTAEAGSLPTTEMTTTEEPEAETETEPESETESATEWEPTLTTTTERATTPAPTTRRSILGAMRVRCREGVSVSRAGEERRVLDCEEEESRPQGVRVRFPGEPSWFRSPPYHRRRRPSSETTTPRPLVHWVRYPGADIVRW